MENFWRILAFWDFLSFYVRISCFGGSYASSSFRFNYSTKNFFCWLNWTYSEMWTKISSPSFCGVMKPWPLPRQKDLMVPFSTGFSRARADLREWSRRFGGFLEGMMGGRDAQLNLRRSCSGPLGPEATVRQLKRWIVRRLCWGFIGFLARHLLLRQHRHSINRKISTNFLRNSREVCVFLWTFWAIHLTAKLLLSTSCGKNIK